MELKNTLLAFTTWTSVGNSNWYITAVLALYICVFLAFMISRGNKYIGTLLTTILAVAFIILQIKLKRPSYCYNTIMLFPAGMLFSLIKNRFDQIVTKNDAIYLTGAIGVLGAYLVFFSKRFAGVTFYSIWGILFMALIVMISLKVKVNNNILQWFGSHVFSVYMLQRIPMIVLSHFGFALRHRYAFIAISFAATIVLAYLFDLAIEKIDSLIFLRRKEQQSEKAV